MILQVEILYQWTPSKCERKVESGDFVRYHYYGMLNDGTHFDDRWVANYFIISNFFCRFLNKISILNFDETKSGTTSDLSLKFISVNFNYNIRGEF